MQLPSVVPPTTLPLTRAAPVHGELLASNAGTLLRRDSVAAPPLSAQVTSTHRRPVESLVERQQIMAGGGRDHRYSLASHEMTSVSIA
jgi:hypothetical protein